jgi:hypothetical protein
MAATRQEDARLPPTIFDASPIVQIPMQMQRSDVSRRGQANHSITRTVKGSITSDILVIMTR